MIDFLSNNGHPIPVGSLQKNDLNAFEAFYDMYAPAFFGEIKRALYKQAESEQVLHESFSSIWKSISQFDPSKEHLFTWSLKRVRQEISKKKVNILLQEIFTSQHEILLDEGN